ncbi:MAG: universal stress protein [Myxococcales bacterium]|nr:universal stress protein [Myxococcales bacterium]
MFVDLLQIHRVVVALDASPHSFSTLDAALSLATLLGLEIHGLFVEDIQLQQAAKHHFVHEISHLSPNPTPHTLDFLAQQFQAQRNRITRIFQQRVQKAQLTHSFKVQRGPVGRSIQQTLRKGDLLGLGCLGHSIQPSKTLGSNTEHILQHTPFPTLLSRKEIRIGREILLLFDGSPAALQGLYLGAWLAAQANREKLHVLVWQPPGTNQTKASLESMLHQHSSHLPLSLGITHLQMPSIFHLSRYIDPKDCKFLLFPKNQQTPSNPFHRWIGLFHCPVIVLYSSPKQEAVETSYASPQSHTSQPSTIPKNEAL